MTKSWKHLVRAVIFALGGTFATATSVLAQSITIDGTLSPAQTLTGPTYTIPQSVGQTVGSNLFHSFGIFNLNAGERANFGSAGDIRNILSRVTGGSRSLIDGLIFTNSPSVNLFLINPSGIVFGPNARLNVGGSFVASTANALQFGNIGFFSAIDKNIPSPLLTINPSALLFNQINQNATIQNNSAAPAGIDPTGVNAFGLRVPDGKSLLLVGGNVSMDGGQLNAYGGRVELGGLTEPGAVLLGVDGDNLSLIFPDNVARGSVSLTNQAAIYVEGAGGGNIAVNARNLEILGGSFLSAGIGLFGTAETVAGDITLNATGEIKIAGSGVVNLVSLGSQGNGGNITIDSGSLSLRDGARLAALTFGQGNAGNVTVRAKDAVSLANSNIFSAVDSEGVGNGANIDINAATLSLIDGAQLQIISRGEEFLSQVSSAGRGNAGNVNVKVTGTVDIAGEKNGFRSGIFSNTGTGTVGNGGNITIDSGSFLLRDGAQLSASTAGQGNAGNVTVSAKDSVSLANSNILSAVESQGVGNGGNITINSGSFSLRDGAQLDASTAGQGNAGDVTVNASNRVSINGIDTAFNDRLAQFSTRITNINAASGFFVQSESSGRAGNIQVNSPKVILDNSGRLNAESASGNGGNITLRIPDLLLLRRGSQISNTSGTALTGGNGGNFFVDAGFIVAVLSENSDITTNAFTGIGGNININTNGIYGFQFQNRLTPQSDIVASGSITLNTLDIDPNRGFINLPTNVVNTPSLVAQSCSAFGKKGSEFIVTGRGGLPPSPDDFLSSDVVWSDTRLTALPASGDRTVTQSIPKTSEGVAIVPATGWVFDEKKGEVTLIAANGSSSGAGSNQVKCIVP
ncbi:filamentous hemagglutinin N-terminal domain-containing protein [Tolypothrix sp. VBCCA 56010]|uniref:two-partner secretion domain-containing protein n=1 Tax=Tolypothrix sp. VBCCA 56010 TaxID=3137731 RepID=UPI003D7EA6D6